MPNLDVPFSSYRLKVLNLKPLDAMAQSPFRNMQHASGGGEATAINHLHK
jgi:hypothetical protein